MSNSSHSRRKFLFNPQKTLSVSDQQKLMMRKGKRSSSDYTNHDHHQSKKLKEIYRIETISDVKFFNLPEDILVEILARLPVKLLLQLRCVSKSWLSLISSSYFIKKHLKNSTNDTSFSSYKIIKFSDTHYELTAGSVESFMNAAESGNDYTEENMYQRGCVKGCCNGLICIAVEEENLFLLNPSIRMFKKVPNMAVTVEQGYYNVYGFGFDESNDDYKVVGIFGVSENEGASIARIYSLKTNAWKRIDDFKGGIPKDCSGKFASGKLHFQATCDLSPNRLNIVSLDLESEAYGTVEQPNYGEDNLNISLELLGGCICLFCSKTTRADIWVLKEYIIAESWTKVVSISHFFYPEKVRNLTRSPLCMLSNGEMLLVLGLNFVIYSSRDKSFRYPETSNLYPFCNADIYAESLVKPSIGD